MLLDENKIMQLLLFFISYTDSRLVVARRDPVLLEQLEPSRRPVLAPHSGARGYNEEPVHVVFADAVYFCIYRPMDESSQTVTLASGTDGSAFSSCAGTCLLSPNVCLCT